MLHLHALQGPPPPLFPRPPSSYPATSTVSAPLVSQGGQVVETIVGPKIAAIAKKVKEMCDADAPAPAAE